MNKLINNLQSLDFQKWAALSLLILWASATFSIALMEISFVAALIFGCAWHLKNRSWIPLKIDWMFWGPLVLFFGIVLLSAFTADSEYHKQTTRGIFKIAKPLLAFILAGTLMGSAQTKKQTAVVFAATFLLVSVDSFFQYFFTKDFLRGFSAQQASAGLRLVGPFGDFGRMSCYLILVIPVFALAFWEQVRTKDWRKAVLLLTLTVLGFLLLYLTRTRGAILASVLSFFLLFVYKRWFKALGAGILCFAILLVFTPKSMIIHLDAQAKEQSVVERVELWKRAWHVIEAKPWLGTGINTYNVAHEKYDKTQNWRVRGYYAHNGYLQLAAEIGIPGILALLTFLGLFFFRALAHIRKLGSDPEALIQLGILTGLLSYLLYALVDTGLQSPQSLMSFWLLAGFLMARQRPSNTQESKI